MKRMSMPVSFQVQTESTTEQTLTRENLMKNYTFFLFHVNRNKKHASKREAFLFFSLASIH